ncbi:HD domain-containing protein [Nocardia sp. CDC160]|uniref:HD domain-containing protein n=1 Tax=Nocardia sp. CDC160 TaxID=3112166 RepID=UPI002DB946F7|nr:HD domain-containing protein [Nocardia sp. CDC160]MEC3917912.1 HD domain-containing protein [Nocardia sp. CDC160]
MTSGVLEQALTDQPEPPLRPLPDSAAAILRAPDAPPRLAAHLRAVHNVACQLVDWLKATYSTVQFDADAVLFGAATHDIGKVLHPAELSGTGSAHESAGYQLLLDHGVSESAARFARTHAAWTEPDIGMDDLLVSLADKIWKAKRIPELEALIVQRLVQVSGQEPWHVFMTLDEELDRIAADADQRLAFQAAYPVTT